MLRCGDGARYNGVVERVLPGKGPFGNGNSGESERINKGTTGDAERVFIKHKANVQGIGQSCEGKK